MLLCVGLLAAPLAGCGEPPAAPAPPPGVTPEPEPDFTPVPRVLPSDAALVRFVAIPGCVVCQQMDGMLADLKTKHGASLKIERYDNTNPEARKFLRENKMSDHGMVAFDRAGRAVWKYEGHSLTRAALEQGVNAALSAK